MRHHVFTPSTDGNYRVALLMKGSAFVKYELQKNYVNPLSIHGLMPNNVVAFTLEYN